VITAPPKIMRAVMSIVDKLDIRRRQVLVEALIVEVNFSRRNAELGVNWAEFSKGNGSCAGSRVREPRGTILDRRPGRERRCINANAATATLPTGTTLAVGRLAAAA